MSFNFVNIQAYEIKLTRKFKYTEKPCRRARDASRYIDACYEWEPSKLQVVFVVTITIKVYGCQDLFVKGTNDRYTVSVVKDDYIVASS